MVNPDADGRSWADDEAEEPWRCCGLHSPARSHDWHWVQLPPRPWRTPLMFVSATSRRQNGEKQKKPKLSEPMPGEGGGIATVAASSYFAVREIQSKPLIIRLMI